MENKLRRELHDEPCLYPVLVHDAPRLYPVFAQDKPRLCLILYNSRLIVFSIHREWSTR